MLPSVDEQREALRTGSIGARVRLRILFVGQATHGPTDVVASLARALETLGHRVFHLDPLRHPEVLRRTAGADGGFGPNFLRVDRLTAVLDTFRPQALVLCAGGMVLDDDGAAECARRGVLTLGMTLSDPDVQPSVIDHVHRFDYHTTNAAVALTGYRDAGLGNTLLLPFGIDRSFVLSPTPPDDSLAADVICIGHAVGRPERQQLMSHLAERFDVRVYGKGWRLPGAEVVRGERLIQAARAGRFHINFPLTRAGYWNVKCGVFESVAAGGVVCVPEFEEMARLFRYGSELVAYRDADDLAESLADLLADPARTEAIRRQAFHRLVTEHLYEHRWESLFEELRADLAGPDPAPGLRAGELSRRLADGNPAPRTILVSGYFGAGNRGDDLLLEALASGIERELQGAQVVVAARAPETVELEQGRPAFDRTDPAASDSWAARATSVVLGPGGLWDDYTISRAGGVAGLVNGARVSPAHLTQLPLLVRAHGGRFHVFGMGVGPLRDPAAQAVVRFAGELADSVVVRDTGSAALLATIPGWKRPVGVAPDISYALPLPETAPQSRQHLAVNVRPWRADPAAASRILDEVAEVADELGMALVGVPMQSRDESELWAWAKRSGHQMQVLSATAPLPELVAVLQDAAGVVAMRLHTSLLTHRLGNGVLGVAYDPKITAHFTEVARSNWVLPLSAAPGEIAERLRELVAEPGLSPTTRGVVVELERGAEAAIGELVARLAADPVPEVGAGRGSGSFAPDPEQVELGSAIVRSGGRGDRRPLVARSLTSRGARIYLDEAQVRRGDYATWALNLPAQPGAGLRIEMVLRTEQSERAAARGRLAYEVVVDGRVLFRHDLADWSETNTVWVGLLPRRHSVAVQVRVRALADLAGPGRAGSVLVASVRALPWSRAAGLVWGASSPGAIGAHRDGERGRVHRTVKRARRFAARGRRWLRRRLGRS